MEEMKDLLNIKKKIIKKKEKEKRKKWSKHLKKNIMSLLLWYNSTMNQY